ncbi:LuxR C-terminal-related transcriptional regulator [Paenarthrobacter sp.]|uniref:helix-turn-helix transcriptional regulator n=1 Tax=Paenarthrobacter sp. TaxID=1931993 RepID=UPI002811C04C|nr:LuxR C-terminal-related transcriptional regulator [Paenarthrobacter sp.]
MVTTNVSVPGLISAFAAAASSSGGGREAAAAVVEELCAIAPIAAAAIDEWHPVSGEVNSLVAFGYPETVTAHLSGPGFLVEDAGYQRLVSDASRHALSWGDVANYTESPSVLEVFRPAGFSGGATARLVTRDGRYTGNLHLSTANDGSLPSGVMEAMQWAAPSIANSIDLTRTWRTLVNAMGEGDLAGLVVGHQVSPVPGLPLLPIAPGPESAKLIERTASRGATTAWLWCERGQWYRIRLTAVRGGCLVWGRPADAPHQLTARELVVLTLLAQGLSNTLIARRLGISERTTAHHIEHLMSKLGTPSRAAAAARAVEEGLRVLAQPLPSHRIP